MNFMYLKKCDYKIVEFVVKWSIQLDLFSCEFIRFITIIEYPSTETIVEYPQPQFLCVDIDVAQNFLDTFIIKLRNAWNGVLYVAGMFTKRNRQKPLLSSKITSYPILTFNRCMVLKRLSQTSHGNNCVWRALICDCRSHRLFVW